MQYGGYVKIEDAADLRYVDFVDIIKQIIKLNAVKIGDRVEVTRINGEKRTGTVLQRVEFLRHIGDYFLVGDPAEEPVKRRGRPRKEEKEKKKEAISGTAWGMYDACMMRVLPERARKTSKRDTAGA